jgi:hypothetical protein
MIPRENRILISFPHDMDATTALALCREAEEAEHLTPPVTYIRSYYARRSGNPALWRDASSEDGRWLIERTINHHGVYSFVITESKSWKAWKAQRKGENA